MSAAQMFLVTVEVNQDMLSDLLIVVNDRRITLKGVQPVIHAAGEPAVEKVKNIHYANGVRHKGIRGDELLLQLLRGRASMTLGEITQAFVGRGFSPNSPSPCLGAAMRTGAIKRNADQSYSIVVIKDAPLSSVFNRST